MEQPATAFFTCSHCGAAYDSFGSLRGHEISAHRGSLSGQCLSEHGGTPEESSEIRSSEQQNPPDHEGRAPKFPLIPIVSLCS
jgi:hypothetical protein